MKLWYFQTVVVLWKSDMSRCLNIIYSVSLCVCKTKHPCEQMWNFCILVFWNRLHDAMIVMHNARTDWPPVNFNQVDHHVLVRKRLEISLDAVTWNLVTDITVAFVSHHFHAYPSSQWVSCHFKTDHSLMQANSELVALAYWGSSGSFYYNNGERNQHLYGVWLILECWGWCQ